jgi:subtilisin family serine protease
MIMLLSSFLVYLALESPMMDSISIEGSSKVKQGDLMSLEEVFPSHFVKPRKYRVFLDVSVPEIHAIDVWRIRDLHGRYLNGSGVAIGIIDTGIDYTHPDFYFLNGTSKILAIWDQTLDGKPPRNFSYGYECTRREIEDRTCPQRDTVGHGTHVASIAAGTGRAGPYTGVAPGALLIIVKSGYPACNGTQWFMDEDKIIDGLYYIAGKARELGLRVVINLSLGSDLGGHDGSSNLEKVLEKLVDDGVVVVAAAGNSGDEKIHASGSLNIGEKINLKWFIPALTTSFGLSLWLDYGDEVILTLETPSNITIQAPIVNRFIDGVKVSLTRNSYDTGVEWLLELTSSLSLPSQGWSIEIEAVETRGSRIWHAWVSSDTCSSYREGFIFGEGYNISQNYTIAIPATSHRVIAVGGYVTKNTWKNYLGEELNTFYNIGEVLSFSSRGPTRDGRVKPEILAPGSVIVAARPVSDRYSRLDIYRYYTVKHGTSMSSPHAAGVAAIILQFKPNASYIDVLNALKSSARWSEEYGERPNNIWGWGKLDARVFYNVSIRLEGLPEDVSTNMYVNDSIESISIDKPIEKVFLKGSTAQVRVQKMIELLERNVRYIAEKDTFIIQDKEEVTVSYVPEYYLEVESELGGEYGSGWYKKDTVAAFSARSYAFPEGLEILFKPIHILSGWIDEEGRILQENKIVMDSPHKVKAIYSQDYGLLYTGWIIISSSVILTIVIALKYMIVLKSHI